MGGEVLKWSETRDSRRRSRTPANLQHWPEDSVSSRDDNDKPEIILYWSKHFEGNKNKKKKTSQWNGLTTNTCSTWSLKRGFCNVQRYLKLKGSTVNILFLTMKNWIIKLRGEGHYLRWRLKRGFFFNEIRFLFSQFYSMDMMGLLSILKNVTNWREYSKSYAHHDKEKGK